MFVKGVRGENKRNKPASLHPSTFSTTKTPSTRLHLAELNNKQLTRGILDFFDSGESTAAGTPVDLRLLLIVPEQAFASYSSANKGYWLAQYARLAAWYDRTLLDRRICRFYNMRRDGDSGRRNTSDR